MDQHDGNEPAFVSTFNSISLCQICNNFTIHLCTVRHFIKRSLTLTNRFQNITIFRELARLNSFPLNGALKHHKPDTWLNRNSSTFFCTNLCFPVWFWSSKCVHFIGIGATCWGRGVGGANCGTDGITTAVPSRGEQLCCTMLEHVLRARSRGELANRRKKSLWFQCLSWNES